MPAGDSARLSCGQAGHGEDNESCGSNRRHNDGVLTVQQPEHYGHGRKREQTLVDVIFPPLFEVFPDTRPPAVQVGESFRTAFPISN